MSAQELAGEVMAGSRRNFQDDGFVQPALMLLGGQGDDDYQDCIISFTPAATDLISRAVYVTASVYGALLERDPSYIVSTFEAWAKRIKKGDEGVSSEEEAMRFIRDRYGSLRQAGEAGDPSVETVIVVTVVDVKSPESSHHISHHVDSNETFSVEGVPSGAVGEAMVNAAREWGVLRPSRPPSVTFSMVSDELSSIVDQVMLRASEPPAGDAGRFVSVEVTWDGGTNGFDRIVSEWDDGPAS